MQLTCQPAGRQLSQALSQAPNQVLFLQAIHLASPPFSHRRGQAGNPIAGPPTGQQPSQVSDQARNPASGRQANQPIGPAPNRARSLAQTQLANQARLRRASPAPNLRRTRPLNRRVCRRHSQAHSPRQDPRRALQLNQQACHLLSPAVIQPLSLKVSRPGSHRSSQCQLLVGSLPPNRAVGPPLNQPRSRQLSQQHNRV